MPTAVPFLDWKLKNFTSDFDNESKQSPSPNPQATKSSHTNANPYCSTQMCSAAIFNLIFKDSCPSRPACLSLTASITVAVKLAPKFGWNLSKQDQFSRSNRASELQRKVSEFWSSEPAASAWHWRTPSAHIHTHFVHLRSYRQYREGPNFTSYFFWK